MIHGYNCQITLLPALVDSRGCQGWRKSLLWKRIQEYGLQRECKTLMAVQEKILQRQLDSISHIVIAPRWTALGFTVILEKVQQSLTERQEQRSAMKSSLRDSM